MAKLLLANVPAFFDDQVSVILRSATLAATIYILYAVVDAIYKLYFHPLAKFPGPKQACLSKKWLLRVSQQGHAEELFEELHRKYNTRALRIAPNELHVDDVSLYKTIYNQTSAFVKDPEFYDGFGTPHTVFAENVPALHKRRRRLLNPFFSRSAIAKIEDLLKGKTYELGKRLDRQNGPANVYNAFRCMTVDIISHYCMGKPLGQLKSSDNNFYGSFLVAFDAVAQSLWQLVYQPVLRMFITSLPKVLARALSADARSLFVLADTAEEASTKYRKEQPPSEYPIIFSALMGLSAQDVAAEAVDLLVAGSDTTAFSLTTAIANILQSDNLQQRLSSVLEMHIKNAEELPSLLDLEGIELLNGCVREAIRFASPVPGRLPRVVPRDRPLIVDGQVVPGGGIVGMSAYTMHHSEALWGKDAALFKPDRWLGEEGKSLDQYMVSFSKGLRSCLGQNLAYAEIHIVLAYLFRKYTMELVHDYNPVAQRKDAFTYFIPEHGLMVNLRSRKT